MLGFLEMQNLKLLFPLFFACLSIRSPGPVTPRDVECEGFDLTYARISNDRMSASPSTPSSVENDIDKKVDDAIGSFLLTLSQIGPELLSVRICLHEQISIETLNCLTQYLLFAGWIDIKFL